MQPVPMNDPQPARARIPPWALWTLRLWVHGTYIGARGGESFEIGGIFLCPPPPPGGKVAVPGAPAEMADVEAVWVDPLKGTTMVEAAFYLPDEESFNAQLEVVAAYMGELGNFYGAEMARHTESEYDDSQGHQPEA
jgi:hypothetical protein